MKSSRKELFGRIFAVVVFASLTIFGFGFSIYLINNANNAYSYFLAFSYLILSIVAGLFNTFTAYSYYRSYLYAKYLKKIQKTLKPIKDFPKIAVAIAVFNENPKEVDKNIKRLLELNYPKDKINFYMLDDSTNIKKASDIKKSSLKYNYKYIHRTDRKGYKAGALNNLLKDLKEEYLAIFDYDEYLTNKNFLLDLLPYFEDSKLAYIQTEKRYKKHTFFSDTIDLFDAFFFKFIQPSRALNNTAIFAGSCGLIRTELLKKIGGFPEYVIEDTFFSFESDIQGFKSLYIPKIYALGKPIESFTELVKQQWRYNYGDTQFLGYFIKRTRYNTKKALSPLSNVDYMTHGFGLNYISVMLILFTLISIMIVFSQLPVSQLNISNIFTSQYISFDLELLGVGALFVSIIAPIIITKIYFNSIKKGFMIFLLNFALSFVRAKAAFSAIFRKKYNVIWDRHSKNNKYGKIIYALRNSVFEITFSVMLFIFSIFAILINNIFGGIWLLWYGFLYISTLFMFYKYR
ncbi:MAG: glycosyltransferase [Candidatus Micrarchaeaceae archaeon]